MKELRKNKLIQYLALSFLLFGIPQVISSQDNTFGVLFYNVENLFDTKDDSLKRDEEFLPDGEKHWNNYRYSQKLKNIARVIYESGGWNPPALVGLCEVENKKVIDDLIWQTGLNNKSYHSIHFESPDLRGIDVALLYRKEHFTPLESSPIKVSLGHQSRQTRDILYVFGLLKDTIPLHVFVTHFPSRYGGVAKSKPKRYAAATILNDTIQSIYKHDPNANMIIMGDFNDNPTDESMQKVISEVPLQNLSVKPGSLNNSTGTLKHRFEWNIFDQFIVSKEMLSTEGTLVTTPQNKILDYQFLLEKDNAYTGNKPFRTYLGYKFINGFSDHLPIWMNLEIMTP
ncbi:endonuclease [Labilibacter sediminis]|nr:endonuclease [Labilibacter sediminis]